LAGQHSSATPRNSLTTSTAGEVSLSRGSDRTGQADRPFRLDRILTAALLNIGQTGKQQSTGSHSRLRDRRSAAVTAALEWLHALPLPRKELMKINDTVADAARAAHDVGLAAWLGGAMFGKFALVAVNAILAQTNHSRPSTRRALRRSSSPNGRSPLWIGSGIVTTAALADQLRRRFA